MLLHWLAEERCECPVMLLSNLGFEGRPISFSWCNIVKCCVQLCPKNQIKQVIFFSSGSACAERQSIAQKSAIFAV